MTAAVTEGVTAGVTETWLGVTAAAQMAGVSKRTIRRWIAEDRVISRLEERDGLELRFVRGDTLPAVTGDITGDDSRERLSGAESSAPGDDTGDGTGVVTGLGGDAGLRQLVDAQSGEISYLRAQLDARTAAEAELRRLLLVAQQSLQTALEQKALPPAVEVCASAQKRVRWWARWRR